MIVNPDVHGYTETLNHRKILRKTQKKHPPENQNNRPITIVISYKLSGGQVLHLAREGRFPPLPPSITPLWARAFSHWRNRVKRKTENKFLNRAKWKRMKLHWWTIDNFSANWVRFAQTPTPSNHQFFVSRKSVCLLIKVIARSCGTLWRVEKSWNCWFKRSTRRWHE